MPNIKSAKKRCKVTSVKTMQNQVQKSMLKTDIKKYKAEANGNPEAVKAAYKALDQAVAKGIIHKNTAAHKKSQIASSVK